jgi:uncharacterized membrane protein
VSSERQTSASTTWDWQLTLAVLIVGGILLVWAVARRRGMRVEEVAAAIVAPPAPLVSPWNPLP